MHGKCAITLNLHLADAVGEENTLLVDQDFLNNFMFPLYATLRIRKWKRHPVLEQINRLLHLKNWNCC